MLEIHQKIPVGALGLLMFLTSTAFDGRVYWSFLQGEGHSAAERGVWGLGAGQNEARAQIHVSATASSETCVRVKGFEERVGDIRVAIYNSRSTYMDESKMFRYFVVALESCAEKVIELSLADFPGGEYAFMCYQDKNRNGRLDRNMMGVPTEPYGFSRKARPKFRAPTWDETKVQVSALDGGKCVPIEIKSW